MSDTYNICIGYTNRIKKVSMGYTQPSGVATNNKQNE